MIVVSLSFVLPVPKVTVSLPYVLISRVGSYDLLALTVNRDLRNALFQRGGLDVTLCLKLQSITGVEIVSDKDFTAAFKEKQALVKAFSKAYPFDTTAS